VMHMFIKAGTGGVTHDAGRARDFITDAVEHAPVNAGQRRGCPCGIGGVLHDTGGEIAVEVHLDILGDRVQASWLNRGGRFCRFPLVASRIRDIGLQDPTP